MNEKCLRNLVISFLFVAMVCATIFSFSFWVSNSFYKGFYPTCQTMNLNVENSDSNIINGVGPETNNTFYVVCFRSDGVQCLEIESYEEGDTIFIPSTFEKQGFDFVRWNWSKQDGTSIPEPTTMPAYDIYADAVWKISSRADYKVFHNIEISENEFSVYKSETFKGEIGEFTNASPISIEFYSLITTGDYKFVDAVVTTGNEICTSVYYYYERILFNISLVEGTGSVLSVESLSVKHGESVVVSNNLLNDTYKNLSLKVYKNDSFNTQLAINNDVFVMPTCDVKIESFAEKQQYTISFESLGGGEIASIVAIWGETITKPAENPDKVGYTFDSWYLSEDNGVTLTTEYVFLTMPTKNITLFAKYLPNTNTLYQVKHYCEKLDYDSEINRYQLQETESLQGTTLTNTNAQSKDYEGFVLKGDIEQSSINPDGTTVVDIFYDREIFTIEYKSADETTGSIERKFGSHLTSEDMQDFEKSKTCLGCNYFFNWYVEGENETENVFNAGDLTINTNISLVANVKAVAVESIVVNSTKHKSIYSQNSELIVANLTIAVDYNISNDILKLPSQINVEKSWVSGFTTENIASDLSANISYQGKTASLIYSVSLTPTYLVWFEGGENVEGSAEIFEPKTAGNVIVLPQNTFVKNEYLFVGWSFENSIYNENTDFTIPEKDVCFNAVWKINQYSYTFYDFDGTTVLKTSKIDYNTTIVAPEEPTKNSDNTFDYDFEKWSPSFVSGMVITQDIVFVAVCKKIYINYSVSFNVEGLDSPFLLKNDYHYGDTIAIPSSEPNKAKDKVFSYKFSKWKNYESGQKVEQDIVFVAEFLKEYVEYKAVFLNEVNGSVYQEKNDYYYGQEIKKPTTSPTKENMCFVEWHGFVQGMRVVGDNTFYAVFEKPASIVIDGNGYTGGKIPQIQNAYIGKVIKLPDTEIEKSGYKLVGWTDGTQNYDIGTKYTINDESVYLVAIWEFDRLSQKNTFILVLGVISAFILLGFGTAYVVNLVKKKNIKKTTKK